jgi:UbiD family decarboxylase
MVVGAHHARLMAEKYWASGKDAPVVVLGGQDPYVYAGACAPLPWGCSELDYAGGLKGGPIDVIIEPETGLPIPAQAEIAVIGRVPPPEEDIRIEGPFGECPGYYTGSEPNTIIHVEKIWHRNDPILQGNPTMRGSAIRHALGANLVTSGRIWDTIEQSVPNIRGVYSLYQQCQAGSDVLVISLKQSYPGHARHAALAALSAQAAIIMNRAVITVDEDVDPSNPQEVLWALVTRCHPDEDMVTIRGIPSLGLDARIPPEKRERKDFTSSTVLIDACMPYAWKDRFPKANVLSPELKSEVLSKWGKTLGLRF